jgi:transcription elongation GreA/GreB family factor
MSAPVRTATVAPDTTVVLTTEGRLLLADRLGHLRHIAIPALVPLLADRERDERDTAEFERLTAESDRLEHLLATAGTVVPSGTGTVELGSRVLLRLARGVQEWVRPVHPVEATLDDERISMMSPLSQALLGAKVGQTVTVHGPTTTWKATIREIQLP